MIKGEKEGFEVFYDNRGEPIFSDDEILIAELGQVFPKIYSGWDYFGIHVVFVPLSQGRLYITTERILFIADSEDEFDYRDFFSIPYNEIYGTDFKEQTLQKAQDLNIYIRTLDDEDYTLSFVVPLITEKDRNFLEVLEDLKVDSLDKLKIKPKYFKNKIDFVRRNKWIKYTFSQDIRDTTISAPCIVEEVYLINKEGLLISHDTWKDDSEMDADIFSGMVITMQNFLKDSFAQEKGLELKMIDLGNFKIYIESGEYLFLLVVYTGIMSESLKDRIKEALVEIENLNQHALSTWDGDVSSITGVSEILNGLFI